MSCRRSLPPSMRSLPARIRLLTGFAGVTRGWTSWRPGSTAGAVLDCAEQHRAWAAYAVRVPAPADRDGDQAFDRWEAAGPVNTPRGSAFAVMSSGEQRLVRLVATLCPRVRVPWSVDEIGFDHHSAAVLADWLAIVRRQLPNALYPTLR